MQVRHRATGPFHFPAGVIHQLIGLAGVVGIQVGHRGHLLKVSTGLLDTGRLFAGAFGQGLAGGGDLVGGRDHLVGSFVDTVDDLFQRVGDPAGDEDGQQQTDDNRGDRSDQGDLVRGGDPGIHQVLLIDPGLLTNLLHLAGGAHHLVKGPLLFFHQGFVCQVSGLILLDGRLGLIAQPLIGLHGETFPQIGQFGQDLVQLFANLAEQGGVPLDNSFFFYLACEFEPTDDQIGLSGFSEHRIHHFIGVVHGEFKLFGLVFTHIVHHPPRVFAGGIDLVKVLGRLVFFPGAKGIDINSPGLDDRLGPINILFFLETVFQSPGFFQELPAELIPVHEHAAVIILRHGLLQHPGFHTLHQQGIGFTSLLQLGCNVRPVLFADFLQLESLAVQEGLDLFQGLVGPGSHFFHGLEALVLQVDISLKGFFISAGTRLHVIHQGLGIRSGQLGLQ